MTKPTYRIETIADMLKVPADRRGVMLRELELALLTHEFSAGVAKAAGVEWPPIAGTDWTDDGDHATHVSLNGDPLLAIRVKSGLTGCAADKDGDCTHGQCPQLRDNEPHATGRHCPLDA